MAKKFSLETVINLADGITKPLAKAEKDLLKFSGKIKKSWGGFGKDIKAADQFINKAALGIVATTGAAAAGIVIMADKATEAWNHQVAALASVDATLKSTGGTVGRTLSQLEAQASSIQKNTFIGDEAVLQGVTAQMLTFTNITGTAFDLSLIHI